MAVFTKCYIVMCMTCSWHDDCCNDGDLSKRCTALVFLCQLVVTDCDVFGEHLTAKNVLMASLGSLLGFAKILKICNTLVKAPFVLLNFSILHHVIPKCRSDIVHDLTLHGRFDIIHDLTLQVRFDST